MKTWQGSCHCGAVKFELHAELDSAIQCNCSICSKKGALHHRVPADQFNLLSSMDTLSLYQFDSKEAKHYFCKTCGIHSFSHPRFDPAQVSVNIRCLDNFDLEHADIDIIPFDGQNWEATVAKIRAEK